MELTALNTHSGEPIAVTGSDDCTALIWDLRCRNSINTIKTDYQVTSVALSDDSSQLFTGSIDNEIKCWDLVAGKMAYALQGHTDTITDVKLSPDGRYLLSNAMDNTLRCWDVRPYVSNTRLVKVFEVTRRNRTPIYRTQTEHKCSTCTSAIKHKRRRINQFQMLSMQPRQ